MPLPPTMFSVPKINTKFRGVKEKKKEKAKKEKDKKSVKTHATARGMGKKTLHSPDSGLDPSKPNLYFENP